jgi:hypothetical protein
MLIIILSPLIFLVGLPEVVLINVAYLSIVKFIKENVFHVSASWFPSPVQIILSIPLSFIIGLIECQSLFVNINY